MKKEKAPNYKAHSLLFLFVLLLFSSCRKKDDELVIFHCLKDDFTETIKVNGTIEAVNTTYLKSPRMSLSTIIWLEEDGKYVKKGDTVCILEHPETQARLESFEDELETMQSQLDKLQADHQVKLALLQTEIENNKIQLSINSLDSIQKKFAPPLQRKIISLEQKKAALIKEKLEKKFASQETIGGTEIRGLKSRIRQMENRIQRIEDQLKQLIITAPIDGLLLRQELPNIFFFSRDGFASVGGKMEEGSMTWTNMNILEIPDLSKMQIKAELSETDYKKAAENQKVHIRVEAKDNLITSGKIKRKMLTGKRQSRNSNIKTYEAIVEVDSCHTQLTPGMNAECEIIINEIQDTLVVPAVAVFEEKEEKFVYLREGKKFRKVPVKTGTMNTTWCIISSGLSEDSYIALSKPSAAKIIEEKLRVKQNGADTRDSLVKEAPGKELTSIINK